ncbi:arginine methyl transferase [Boletus edulis BED1]|uniref:Arginine methyl transferase n=1 Tax=Boletus edulis BED1 TaxID=1328754 RepID=A0AAD4GHN0_BOLED|nr:arginine methyl transferase [Boletus edulis BED1]
MSDNLNSPLDPDNAQITQDVEDMEEINAITELGTTLIQAILEKEPLDNIRDLIDARCATLVPGQRRNLPLARRRLVKLLLDEGAVWNAVDNLGNTAGDIALSMNSDACYTLIRDTGIRTELLLTLVSSKSALVEAPSSLIICQDDESALGSTDAFLASCLQYTKDASGQEICLLKLEDGEQVGVMMGWERDIMRKTVDELCSSHPKLDTGLRVLNVGFGLGIIDTMFQSLSKLPSLHVIVEPHPDVLAHMEEKGWHEKANWQDVLSSDEFLGLGKFDVVYTDTFAEHYGELHKFFKRLPDLLDGPDARFSFFNGLAATSKPEPLSFQESRWLLTRGNKMHFFTMFYTRVSDCHLSEIGATVDWHDVEVGLNDPEDDSRWGGTRRYFTLPIYRLPIAQLKKE